MGVKLWKRNGIYWIRVWHNGKCDRWSLDTKRKSEADRKVKEIENEIETGQYDGVRDVSNIEDFLDEYWEYAEGNKASATVAAERLGKNNFFEIVGEKSLDKITRDDVELFKKKRLKKGKKPNGINTDLRHLRSVLSYAVRWGYLQSNPIANKDFLKTPKNPPKFCTVEERDALLKVAREHGGEIWSMDIYLVFALGFLAGLRKKEIVNARWEWFDFSRKLITIRNFESFQVKNLDSRTLPMSDMLMGILEPFREDSGYILNGENNTKSRYRYEFRKAFDWVKKECGLEWITPHVLRHTFASHLVDSGVSLYKVQKWLGHKDPKTTMIYAHLSEYDEDINVLNGANS